jgi:hypothetical protein
MSLRASVVAAFVGCTVVLALPHAEAARPAQKSWKHQPEGQSTQHGSRLHLVRPPQARTGFKANTLGIPSSGTYRQAMPPGSLTMWNVFHYQEVRPGIFLIRDTCGGGRPNPFDHGTIVNEFDMYRKLVEAGAIRP